MRTIFKQKLYANAKISSNIRFIFQTIEFFNGIIGG